MVKSLFFAAPNATRRFGAAATIILLFAATPASAAAKRLSADLQDRLNAGSASIDVILDGDQATINQLASRYNLTVSKRLRSGAVVRVTAGQLAALREDDAFDHLSGDVKIQAHLDVTPESIGADQVWAGIGGLRGLTGRGIGVAVIDSGIDATHSALRGRVVATVDFTGGNGQ